ncbi:hypothetical protein [Actinacidiphila paucisporea]|uniref:Secreted protein n=1 Tax=Actinacidiphila paucisporea TaxID=310782 RepID=A0A1M6WLD3_9ACTN|nr:hypothetical protein [Actinacidiphila paucisporea]SHK94345.1 hypothetical protein SAMN05216499_102142 [Actinacidiphila paucisporea]
MADVHRGLLHTCVWALTTAAAATLSWFGVHSVLRGTAYDPPRALPVTAPAVASSTHRPRTVAPATPARRRPSTRPPSRSASPSPSSSPSTSAPGHVHGYTMRGGRVVLALGPSTATLVSATPNPGWDMQVWPEDGWLRVTFTSGGSASTVFCTWNGHPPAVQSYEE